MKNNTNNIEVNLNEINSLAQSNPARLVVNSEEFYKRQIKSLVSTFCSSQKKYRFIMLAGPSSAGKTTTSSLIRRRLMDQGINTLVISLDNFFVDRDKTPKLSDGTFDFESIFALDLECYNTFLGDLLKDGRAMMPEFDFLTGTRKEKMIEIEADENTVVIFEGIHALNPLLIDRKFDDVIFKVYLSIGADVFYNKKLLIPAKTLRLMRRILRDHQTRGHSVVATLEMWPNVLAGEDKYIRPFKSTVDFSINTMHFYEPLLYASHLLPLLARTEDKRVEPLKKALEKCVKLSKHCVPRSSLLWEFLVM